VQIWWGDTLLDQRATLDGALDASLRARWVSADAPERVKTNPLEALKDFAAPGALICMLLGALVVAVVPTRDDGWMRSLSAGSDGSAGDGAEQAVNSPVRVASVNDRSNHGDARVVRDRRAILELDAPTPDAPPVAPKDAAKQLVDQIFAGVGELAQKSNRLDEALGSLSVVGTTFAGEPGALGLRAQSGGSGGPLSGEANIGTLGSIGTRGRGGGDAAYGSGVGLIAGRKPQVIVDIIAPPVVVGGLDKELIRRVVRSHSAEIRYCYELALSREPELAGRVMTRFVIAADGAVAIAEVTEGLGDAQLDECLISRLRRWQFPSSRGGGVVVVNYPWQFSPGS
jgi:TonB family protein